VSPSEKIEARQNDSLGATTLYQLLFYPLPQPFLYLP
jgi:hypothetical protein